MGRIRAAFGYNPGMNKPLPTPFAVGRTAEVYDWDGGQVLKLYRDWCPADWIEHEARIGRMVYAAGVPSPQVLDTITVNGRRGIVYERVEGVEMLAWMARSPLKIAEYGRMLARLHLEMHRASGGELPSMKGGAAYSIRAAKALPDDLRKRALEALDALPEGDRLCHGDFHPGNVMLARRGPVVIDWMTAKRGNPAADVARTRLLLMVGDPPQRGLMRLLILLGRRVFMNAYLRAYRAESPEVLAQSDAFLPVMAAARLNEEIEPERERVLEMVRVGLEKISTVF